MATRGVSSGTFLKYVDGWRLTSYSSRERLNRAQAVRASAGAGARPDGGWPDAVDHGCRDGTGPRQVVEFADGLGGGRSGCGNAGPGITAWLPR